MEGWREIISLLDKHPSLCIALASLLSAFISGVIAASVSIVTLFVLRRSEELKLRSDIAVRIGVECFKYAFDILKSSETVVKMFPLEYWILSSVKLAELLSTKNITTEIAKTKMKKCIKFTQEIQETLEKNQPTSQSSGSLCSR